MECKIFNEANRNIHSCLARLIYREHFKRLPWHHHLEKKPEGVLAAVGHVEESVLVLVLLVNCRHQSGCWWKCVLHKDENRLLSTELDPLANNVDKLPNCKISGHQVSV